MNNKLLISCRNLGYSATSAEDFSAETMWDICKFNLDLHAGERISFYFKTEEQKSVLWRLFERKLKPKTGSLRISASTHIHTDQGLLDGLDKSSSLQENLQSRLFEERPWFGGKRKTMDTLMYRLGLIGRIQYLPVNDLSDQHLTRFWTLMLAAAKTRVFMLDRLLPLLDEISMSFLLEWMESFPGSIIVFGEHANILNAVESRQDKQMALSRSLFDLGISFTSYGEAKTLINNQKKFIDDK
jgi:ATPase subunit of ABC transporter with duplicated ATPase domains